MSGSIEKGIAACVPWTFILAPSLGVGQFDGSSSLGDLLPDSDRLGLRYFGSSFRGLSKVGAASACSCAS